MKTPIQELIDEMQKSPLMFASALAFIEEIRMLEKEKEVIMDAYENGFVDGWYGARYNNEPKYAGAEEYFNETFKITQE